MPDDEATPKPGVVKFLVVGVVTLAAAFHAVTITLAALPDNAYSASAQTLTQYHGSYFAQNWRLFAPNPVSSDREVRVQAAVKTADGTVETTDWVDWTDVELDLVRHQLVGGRAGYVTNKLFGPLGSRYAALGAEQKKTADVVDPEDVLGWTDLAKSLTAAAESERGEKRVSSFLSYERASARLATAVLRGRHPDSDIVAVRYATRKQDVTPWNQRHASAEDRERLRRSASERISGWRMPVDASAAEQKSIADFDRRHR